jgi:hypothetical protein
VKYLGIKNKSTSASQKKFYRYLRNRLASTCGDHLHGLVEKDAQAILAYANTRIAAHGGTSRSMSAEDAVILHSVEC